ncbi:hypothetical protein CsSME_00049247 [Camellia sinensis var. sinensis]
MLPMREETRLRRRILFLGGWSFEIEETAARQWGHRCLTIVERGQGLCREVRLKGSDIVWQLGLVVVTSEGKRTQVFLSRSEFGDGWEGVALVMEGFAKGDGWVTKIDEAKRKTTARRVVMSSVGFGESVEGGAKMVQGVAKKGWFGLLERVLVGRVGEEGSKGVGFSAMTEWVRQWWKMVRKVEIRPIGSQDFLFVLPSRREVEEVMRRR